MGREGTRAKMVRTRLFEIRAKKGIVDQNSDRRPTVTPHFASKIANPARHPAPCTLEAGSWKLEAGSWKLEAQEL
jgi:hypothetical protein